MRIHNTKAENPKKVAGSGVGRRLHRSDGACRIRTHPAVDPSPWTPGAAKHGLNMWSVADTRRKRTMTPWCVRATCRAPKTDMTAASGNKGYIYIYIYILFIKKTLSILPPLTRYSSSATGEVRVCVCYCPPLMTQYCPFFVHPHQTSHEVTYPGTIFTKAFLTAEFL